MIDRSVHLDAAMETLLAQCGDDPFGAVSPPIYQTALFSFENYADFMARMSGESSAPLYTRVQNPTVAAFETLMAKLEGGEAAVGFASGMGAISGVALAFLRPGNRLVCTRHVYSDAYRFFEQILRPMGVEVTYHSADEFENDPDLLRGATLAYLESPNSIVLETMNLSKVAEHAKRHGTLTVIDNSWATPIFQKPLQSGIDIVLHSASKYLSGHSDTVAGVVISNRALTQPLRDLSLALLGAKLAPFEAWLLVRGLRTLPARMRQHQATANRFIERLAPLAGIAKVHSPGANRQPGLQGRSGLLSIEFKPQLNIAAFADHLKLFRLGVSWGGYESLCLPAEVGLRQAGEHNPMCVFGVPETLIRLSLGLEDAEDLWRDFEHAYHAAIETQREC